MINNKSHKPIILCLVGRSGCGKTTASLWLQNNFKYINTIISCTTRPMRNGETNGIDHWFIENKKENIPPSSKMLAYTKYGDYEYWTKLDDIKLDKINVYVIDEKGINDLIRNHGDKYKIFICNIIRQGEDGADTERRERDKKREPLMINYPHWIINNNDTIGTLYNKISQVIDNLIIWRSYHYCNDNN